jgi:murein DD-endopeptidase MepM/ murein hydrolase activator NlpD
MHPEAPRGRWYVVTAGDTLDGIARQAGVPAEDILEVNGLSRPEEVTAGRLIFVLEPDTPAARAIAAGAPSVSSEPAGPPPALRWPLAEGRIVIASAFGIRDGKPHEGIDLPAPVGTPVLAAADGRVVYAGSGVRGYGNLVVIRHGGDLLTVYAHSSVILVSQGQPVRAGDRIALVGQSGRATGPHLHFEVRAGQIPKDPMSFLPRWGQ